MKTTILMLLLISMITGCASKKTKYQPDEGKGGYSEKPMDDKMISVRFTGNAFTDISEASTLSQFRAFEICNEKGFKITRLYDTENRTTSKTVGHSAAEASYFKSFGSAQASSWNETYNFPAFITYFKCSNEAFMTKLKLKPISIDDMKPFVKDLMGAMQVEGFGDDSPNEGTLLVGDFIVRINGSRVQNNLQYITLVESAKDKNSISMNIIRDGKPMKVTVKAVVGTSFMETQEKERVNFVCKGPEMKERPICQQPMPATKQRVVNSTTKNEEDWYIP